MLQQKGDAESGSAQSFCRCAREVISRSISRMKNDLPLPQSPNSPSAIGGLIARDAST